MECFRVKKLLSDYADGVLDAEAKRRVQEHLSICRVCSAELSSLQALTEDMGSLEKVRAPADFLQNVHARIERGSPLRRLLGKCFYPLRIKVPLELAGLVAAVLLVVSIQQGMLPLQKEEYASPVMQAPSPAMPTQGQTGLASREELKQQPSSSFKSPADEPLEEKKPVVIALLLKPPAESDKEIEDRTPGGFSSVGRSAPTVTDEVRRPALRSTQIAPAAPAGSPEAPKTATGSPGAPRKERDKGAHREGALRKTPEFNGQALEERKKVKETEPSESESTVRRHEASPLDRSSVVARVRNCVLDTGGTILSVEYGKEENQPSSLTASIPAEKFAPLLEKLRLIGELAEYSPPTTPPAAAQKIRESIQVKIEFKTSR